MTLYATFATGIAVLAVLAAVYFGYRLRAAGWTFDALNKAT